MQNKKAFTLVELVFVIALIGILSAVAIPKLAATRKDAVITVGTNVVASVRSAIAIEHQKRIFRGDFSAITTLDNDNDNSRIFTMFNMDNQDMNNSVLEYPVKQGKNIGEWSVNESTYTFHLKDENCTFTLKNNSFISNCSIMNL